MVAMITPCNVGVSSYVREMLRRRQYWDDVPPSILLPWDPGEVAGVQPTLEKLAKHVEAGDVTMEAATVLWRDVTEKVTDDLAKEFAPEMMDSLRKSSREMLRQRELGRRTFESRVNWIYDAAFDELATVVRCCEDLGSSLNGVYLETIADGGEQSDRTEVLIGLWVRAQLTAAEVTALLRSGYPLGARARWRTLHEIAVVTTLVAGNDEAIATRFRAHGDMLAYADAKTPGDSVLGAGQLSEEQIEQLRIRRDEAEALHGPDFGKEYAWARPLLNRDRVTFADLEALAMRDHLRADYKVACHLVHADAAGSEMHFVSYQGHDVWIAGPVEIGLAEPGYATAAALVQISTTVTLHNNRSPHPALLAGLIAIAAMARQTEAAFLKAQRHLESLDSQLDECRDDPRAIRRLWKKERRQQMRHRLRRRLGRGPVGTPSAR